MAAADALAKLRAFNVKKAKLSFWVFKKRSSKKQRFKALHVSITPELAAELKAIAESWISRCSEIYDYDLLAQVNENSCLYVAESNTIFSHLKEVVDRPPEESGIESVKDLEDSFGYVVKIQLETEVLYGVCRVPPGWKIKKRVSLINVVLNKKELDLETDEAFSIAKRFDFFVIGNGVITTNKGNFESILEYKATYTSAFSELQKEDVFLARFSDVAPLIDVVEKNTIHLRRMAVVKEKGFYKDDNYMQRVREISEQRKWNIEFDDKGRIIPSAESARTIMHVLLNHRLHSLLTDDDFDVQGAYPIASKVTP